MSHHRHPGRDDDARDGRPTDGQHMTLSATGPQRPESGSALERLLRRQVGAPGTGRLLGFVPAQVR
jgi:hypothetical protein